MIPRAALTASTAACASTGPRKTPPRPSGSSPACVDEELARQRGDDALRRDAEDLQFELVGWLRHLASCPGPSEQRLHVEGVEPGRFVPALGDLLIIETLEGGFGVGDFLLHRF